MNDDFVLARADDGRVVVQGGYGTDRVFGRTGNDRHDQHVILGQVASINADQFI